MFSTMKKWTMNVFLSTVGFNLTLFYLDLRWNANPTKRKPIEYSCRLGSTESSKFPSVGSLLKVCGPVAQSGRSGGLLWRSPETSVGRGFKLGRLRLPRNNSRRARSHLRSEPTILLYGRSQEFLQTKANEETSEEKLRGSFRKQLLLVAGLGQEEVDKLDLSSMSDEELQSLVRQKLLGAQTPDSSSARAREARIHHVHF